VPATGFPMPPQLTNLLPTIRAIVDDVSPMVPDAVEALAAEVFGLFDENASPVRFCEAVLRYSGARTVFLAGLEPGGAPVLLGFAGAGAPTLSPPAPCPAPTLLVSASASASPSLPRWRADTRVVSREDWAELDLPFLALPASRRSVVCLPLGEPLDGGAASGCLFLVFGDEAQATRLSDGRRLLLGKLTWPLAAALVWRRQALARSEASTGDAVFDIPAFNVHSLNQQLERRVQERTQELARSNAELAASLNRLGEAQEQLIHAGKMAAVGALIAGLSHELNNPLGVIVGYVQGILRRMPEAAADRPALIAVERQALRCAHLVRSLLDFSRHRRATREQTAIAPLMERALDLVAGQARTRQVELRSLPAPALPSIWAAPPEIESALLNLIANAIDATEKGGSVTIETMTRTVDRRAGIDIRVTDTGCGIAPEILPRIFDPFFTTKPVGQGTGIGLAITRQAIEGHGGQIHVQTQEGVGTTMRVWLPTLRDEPATRAVRDPSGHGEGRNDGAIPVFVSGRRSAR
jgi:signal transduction histidine kinase